MPISNDELQQKAIDTIRYMVAEFDKKKTFGHYCEIIPGGDENFTLRDRWLMFRSVPRLRKDLLIGLFLNSLSGRKKHAGLAIKYNGGKYSFHFRSTFDLLAWEIIIDSSKRLGIFESINDKHQITSLIKDNICSVINDGREISYDSNKIKMYSYFPQQDSGIDQNNRFYNQFISWDANIPDNDSTSTILSSILSLNKTINSQECDIKTINHESFIDLLNNHIYTKGKFGKDYLSYSNQVSQKYPGVLTWIFDKHNELDPTANINILNYLVQFAQVFPNKKYEEIGVLSNHIIFFLKDLVDRNILFDKRIQLYYPICSVYFMWYRIMRSIEQSSQSTKKLIDPENNIPFITDYFIKFFSSSYSILSKELNPYDLLLISPFLIKTGSLTRKEWIDFVEPLILSDFFKEKYYHYCHLLYPIKMICCNKMLPYLASICCYTELQLSK